MIAIRRELARTVVIDAIAPYVVYTLAKPELGEMAALALCAVPPALEALWSVWKRKRLDVISGVVLAGIAVSFGLVALGGSERVLLLRESLITSVVGLAIAVTAPLKRPLLWYVLRDTPLAARIRVISLVWGIGLVVEMAVRTAMLYTMETSRFLLVSPFVQYGMTGALVVWTIWSAKNAAKK